VPAWGRKKCIESFNWKGVSINSLDSPRGAWEDDIKMDSREM
jgi:hypothetical protein